MLSKKQKSAYILAMINTGIWAIAMIAMVFLMQDYPGAKGLFPILGGGVAVSILLISAISGLE